MIRPAFKPDWFVVDRELATLLFGVPGIELERPDATLLRVHRSHLALLDDSGAARALQVAPGDWEARNALTQPLGFTLKTVQHQAVDFIRSRRGTLLGDEMRVGKSLSCAYSHQPEIGRLVVIGPLMVREVWLGWIRRIWPGADIGVMTGKTFDREQARKPFVFGHYDILPYWQSGEPIGTLVLDEGHVLTNRNTRRAKAAALLAGVAERVIVATGTPIWNMPPNLWTILSLVAPGAFGGYHDFCQRYAAPQPTAFGTVYTGISNGEELSQRLTQVMIRRRWSQVQQDLPPITRNTLIVDLALKDRRKLDLQAQALRQSERTNTAAELARYREALSRIKLPIAVDKAKELMDRGEPVVLWVWHRNTADALFEQLVATGHDVFLMTGDTQVQHRQKAIDDWRAQPNAALVVTMSVAQVGLDFSHSHLPIFVEIDYTPAMISQAEMRTFAPTRAMSVTYIVADHYADRKIIEALARKLSAAEPIDLGTGEGAIASIDRAFRPEDEAADMDRFMADLLGS